MHRTVSTDGTGIPKLIKIIEEHKSYLVQSGEMEKRDQLRLENEMENLLTRMMMASWRENGNDEHFNEALKQVLSRKKSPREAVKDLLKMKD